MKNWKKAGIAALCVMSLLAGCGMQDGKDDGNGGKDDTPMDVTLETLREVNDPRVLLEKYDAVTVNIQGADRDGEVTTPQDCSTRMGATARSSCPRTTTIPPTAARARNNCGARGVAACTPRAWRATITQA